jgi:hypothetical protein
MSLSVVGRNKLGAPGGTRPIGSKLGAGVAGLSGLAIVDDGTSTVSGVITGPVVENVLVYALSPTTRQVISVGTSNSLGQYTIPGLIDGSTYDILPYIDSHIFTPHQTQVTLTGPDISGVNFASVAGYQYLYDATTVSIVDDLGNRLYEAL